MKKKSINVFNVLHHAANDVNSALNGDQHIDRFNEMKLAQLHTQ